MWYTQPCPQSNQSTLEVVDVLEQAESAGEGLTGSNEPPRQQPSRYG